MVWESWYWKQRLKSHADEIELIAGESDASTLDLSNLEISVCTGFYIIRKLVEARSKLSLRTENQNVSCSVAVKLPDSPVVDVMNRSDIHELYRLENFETTSRSLTYVCNIFIHSVFLWMAYDCSDHPEGQGVVEGVFVTSGYEKDKSVYLISLPEILRVFRSVIKDELSEVHIARDEQTGEMKVIKK